MNKLMELRGPCMFLIAFFSVYLAMCFMSGPEHKYTIAYCLYCNTARPLHMRNKHLRFDGKRMSFSKVFPFRLKLHINGENRRKNNSGPVSSPRSNLVQESTGSFFLYQQEIKHFY